MTHIDTERRKLLLASGTALSVALAGCGGGGGGDDGGNGGGGGDVDVEGEYSDVHSYLSDNSANNYDGSGVDMTGESSVTIEVGAGSSGLAFGPAAVLVDAGTEITWEWTGQGGGHNVHLMQGPVEEFSSETVSEEGHTYSQTLDSAGNYLYQCDPHSANGMHGAVIVQE
jgi:halocyanin-like protein